MIFSDRDIMNAMGTKELLISPFNPAHLQPASYDVHMYSTILRLIPENPVDLKNLNATNWEQQKVPEDGMILWPSMFVLLSTVEEIKLSNGIVCIIDGSSTLSRSGLTVHQTGQWVDPGFNGTLTFECKCTNGVGIIIYPGMKLGQLIFAGTKTKSIHPYKGRYQNQLGPQRPRNRK